MLRGTAPSTTSGPMLSTAPPTARSNSPLKGKWGVERRSARDCRDCRGHNTADSGKVLSFFTHMVVYRYKWLYLGHDGVSLFPCNSIEAAQDLQHKRPGGMEAIRQPFFYNAGTHRHSHNNHNESLQKRGERLRLARLENSPKHFADIWGVPCRGCGSDSAHFLHARGNTFSQQCLKQKTYINHQSGPCIYCEKWKSAESFRKIY